MSVTLAWSCPHTPGMHEDFPDFLRDIYKAWRCDRVICLGDVVDNRMLNFWEKNPDLPSPRDDYEAAKKQVAILHKLFPNIDVLIGNHDALPTRQAKATGIPSWFIKDMAACWDTPTWRWHPRYTTLEHDGVLYQHGDKGRGGGIRPALLNAMDQFQSVVQAHFHSILQVNWHRTSGGSVFGMQVGCGINQEAVEAEYTIKYGSKNIIGCGIIIDGVHAFVERMEL